MLPAELYPIIAAESVEAYRAMLSVPAFARTIDVSAKYDYMVHFGYSVNITTNQITWKLNGKIHRVDGPAVEPSMTADTTKCNKDTWWFYHGAVHRVGGPAIISSSQSCWCIHHTRHRDNGPAVEYSNGDYEYYQNGKLHRTDGPAYCKDGVIAWYTHGVPRQNNGPADANT